ncbi:MAG: AGE family epimerase/isomerase [bacterium]
MSTSKQITIRYQAILSHLTAGIIPFWFDRALDNEDGGYLTNFAEDGSSLGTPIKYSNTQCRLLWWFSQCSRKFPEIAGCKERAQHGFEFMLKNFWDNEFGGWYWTVNKDGSPLDTAKIVYGQSFAIYALSEYTLGTGDPRGLEYASKTFDLLQLNCADTRHGGYYENMQRDWMPETPGFAGGDRKGLDTHMHLMEAFTTLYEASGKPLHWRKLCEVVDLIANKMVDINAGCGLNQFDMAWNPIPAIAIKRTWNAERFGEQPAQPTETTSYGHNLELVWLMNRAMEIAKADPTPYYPLMHRLLDHGVSQGVDWEFGGIYRDGIRGGGPLVLEKEFWQNAESLVGFLDGYQHFGDERYLDAFCNLWDFVAKYMIIAGVGEWRTLLARDGKPLDAGIGNPWKVSYHTGRAMIECVERMRKMME